MSAADKPVIPVAVRALVEFVLRDGDLGGGGDFSGPGRALAGVMGHQRLQRSRPEGYEKEVPVCQDLMAAEFVLRVQGRVDGLMSAGARPWMEEIKTVQGGWDGQASALHWGQARCYGAMLCQQRGWERVTLRLVFLNLDTREVKEFEEEWRAAELAEFFQKTTAVYLEWTETREEWVRLRDASARALAFPFGAYRPGQREMAVAVYRAITRGGRLFLEAPTGIGKTLSVLFPAAKAMGERGLERIYYLTARTAGRAVAEQGLAELRRAGLRVRGVTLTARERICPQPEVRCEPEACPLARGYYDRIKPALQAALEREELTRPVLEALAAAHGVCPFELGLDVSLWVDAVVCDYNHAFDPRAYLRRHFTGEEGQCVFLVDEAHNLPDRAREMFSAALGPRELREARLAVKAAAPRCAKALGKVATALRALQETDEEASEEEGEGWDLFAGAAPATGDEAPEAAAETVRDGILRRRELPAGLTELVETAIGEAEAWLGRNEEAPFRADLMEMYFRLQAFRRAAESFDERFTVLTEPGPAGLTRLFCMDPSRLLGEALGRAKAAVFFSATLTPCDYYQAMLAGDPRQAPVRLPSPFPPENLAVLVHDGIRTDLKARQETLGAVAEALGAAVGGRRGNYIAYFPSYQYLTNVFEAFRALMPEVEALAQRPGMSESEREGFLSAFATDPPRTRVGFAVLGGVFGEGIDLVGDRLIGVVIAGVGLPQLCAERDVIREHFQARNGAGFDYAYGFPGMNRVLQAAGRVIRSETDRGMVLLIDARYGQPSWRRLFPPWWQPQRTPSPEAVREALERFWGGADLEGDEGQG